MGANISGEDYEANDKEVFQSYRIPPKAYKKKSTANSSGARSVKSLSDSSQPVSPTSVEFGQLTSYRNGGGGGGGNKQQNHQPQQQQQQPQTRLRAGSIPSGFNRSWRDRPISHPPPVLSPSSSTSSLNLSIVNAAVAAGSPTSSMYGYSNGLVSAPITLMSTQYNHGAGVGGGDSRTNSGFSIGSDTFDFSTTPHAVGTGLGRATYVNGKMVEAGVHGGSSSSINNSGGGLYMHNNYTVQDFMSYQQQQQQQFLEQQQYEYQQMMILRQQQQQLKLEYEQKQLALLQQQQNLHQNSTQISTPVIATAALPRPSQEYTNTQQITGVVLQTKNRRPARNPDRALSSQNLGNGGGGNGQHRNTSHAIAIPAPTASSLQRQPHTSQSSSRPHHQEPRSPTMSTGSANHNNHHYHYSTSPSGSMASSFNGGASSFSSTGSHYHTMLAMTSAASPPSSSSSSLSNPGGPTSEPATVSTVAATGHGNGASKSTTSLTKSSGLSADELAARILPLRRLLGGREYYPDKTLPYLLPCDEQESERLLLQHYVIRYAFGSNMIPPIDTTVAGKVLDCGCGPGTWVMEMATEYEDLEFYGFDVSPMYPTAIHPKNAHFSMGNLLDPEIPFASDSYLLVHQRNMLLGLTQDAWPGVVQDLFRCVLPGGQGWLQLSEVDPIWSRPGPISRSVLKMLNETAQNRNVDVLLPSRLDQVLKDVGCENVKMMMVEIPIGPWGGKIGMLWRDVLKAEMEALKPVVLQAALENAVASGMDVAVCGAEMTTGEEWEEMMGQVWAEMDQYHTFSRVYLAYGQKP
ncbi:hypothetical protein EC957_011647 [Mortierella hygrophila]|uniref:Methyltransferase domain-containing protein n=1 Tax=Mortierella hygrophila TaxID=979708 RepID=A0A9P6F984_9FUNG|nr:hypothetical protein EC957_011647 [Mortierella hygrophila]